MTKEEILKFTDPVIKNYVFHISLLISIIIGFVFFFVVSDLSLALLIGAAFFIVFFFAFNIQFNRQKKNRYFYLGLLNIAKEILNESNSDKRVEIEITYSAFCIINSSLLSIGTDNSEKESDFDTLYPISEVEKACYNIARSSNSQHTSNVMAKYVEFDMERFSKLKFEAEEFFKHSDKRWDSRFKKAEDIARRENRTVSSVLFDQDDASFKRAKEREAQEISSRKEKEEKAYNAKFLLATGKCPYCFNKISKFSRKCQYCTGNI